MASSEARRDAIREILSGRPVGSQGELLRRLGARGIRASQATLSRDMAILGVRRAVGPDGPRYLVEANGGALPLEPVRRLVDGVESNGALVIVRTKASAAATVARALDEAGLAEVMGTLAGDDTVFVAPRRAGGGHRTAARLRVLFGLG
jgi:transcriptional regulator of arginine metabolism